MNVLLLERCIILRRAWASSKMPHRDACMRYSSSQNSLYSNGHFTVYATAVQWNVCSVMAEVIIICCVPSHPEIIMQLSTRDVLASIVVASIPNYSGQWKLEEKLNIDFHISITSTTVHLRPEITLHLATMNFPAVTHIQKDACLCVIKLSSYNGHMVPLVPAPDITQQSFVICVKFLCSSTFNGNFTLIQP